jgi:hypothetical protein
VQSITANPGPAQQIRHFERSREISWVEDRDSSTALQSLRSLRSARNDGLWLKGAGSTSPSFRAQPRNLFGGPIRHFERSREIPSVAQSVISSAAEKSPRWPNPSFRAQPRNPLGGPIRHFERSREISSVAQSVISSAVEKSLGLRTEIPRLRFSRYAPCAPLGMTGFRSKGGPLLRRGPHLGVLTPPIKPSSPRATRGQRGCPPLDSPGERMSQSDREQRHVMVGGVVTHPTANSEPCLPVFRAHGSSAQGSLSLTWTV